MTRALLLALGLAAVLASSGCSKGEVNVKDSGAGAADFSDPLENENDRLTRPPNVIAESEELLLQIKTAGSSRLLPKVSRARVQREGGLRWLEVDVSADEAWSVLRDFWLDQGFGIEIELPEAGFIETTWRQDRSKVLGTGLSRYLDIAFDVINDTGVRHKFRSRVERNGADSSNIFISHQVIIEGGIGTDGKFSRLPSDPILEVEMLRRLMIAFRAPEESIATLEELTEDIDVNNLYTVEANLLTILRDYDEAWRLLGVSLDRSGLTVVERDKDEGKVTLLFADQTIEKDNLGFFRSLLNQGQEGGEPREVNLSIKPGAGQATVAAPEGEEGEYIISIIAEHL